MTKSTWLKFNPDPPGDQVHFTDQHCWPDRLHDPSTSFSRSTSRPLSPDGDRFNSSVHIYININIWYYIRAKGKAAARELDIPEDDAANTEEEDEEEDDAEADFEDEWLPE